MSPLNPPMTEEAASAVQTATIRPKVITLDPVTRIEGHLKIEVKLDRIDGRLQVVDAWSSGTLFRGIERILIQRDPWDAVPITQRICGVCPVSHGMAAVKTLDAAARVTVPENARILRNLVLGANFLQSNVLHFYHLALLDYVDGPNMPPWEPVWDVDKRVDSETTEKLISHYLQALEIRRKAHEMGGVFGGRLPHPPSYVPGGFTSNPTVERIAVLNSYLREIVPFIRDVWIPDVELLGSIYSDYFEIGRGPGNLLAFGAFDLDASGENMLFARGRSERGAKEVVPVDVAAITEDVTWSWYKNRTDGLRPAKGRSIAKFPKKNAYSWLKAPRYAGAPYEVGPLARMWVNGDYRAGISVMDRHMARALETLKIAQAMQDWAGELRIGRPVYVESAPPRSAKAYGLTEAPRGALGHWIRIRNGKIARYQIVTPTCWNASPRDTAGVPGPIEQALIGTPVSDWKMPIELLRVVHAFDPCMACAVHVMRVGEDRGLIVQNRWAPTAAEPRSPVQPGKT